MARPGSRRFSYLVNLVVWRGKSRGSPGNRLFCWRTNCLRDLCEIRTIRVIVMCRLMHCRNCRPSAVNSRPIGAGRPKECGKMTGSMKIAIIALSLSSVEERCGVGKTSPALASQRPMDRRRVGKLQYLRCHWPTDRNMLASPVAPLQGLPSNPASRQSDFPPTAEESTDRPPAIVPVMAAMQSEPGLVALHLRTHQPILFSIAGKWRSARFSVSEKGRVCQSNRHGPSPGQD